MDNKIKSILTKGLEVSTKKRNDLIISKTLATDCEEKRNDYISLSFDIVQSQLAVTIDDTNRPAMNEIVDIKVIVDSEVVIEEKDHVGSYTTELSIGVFPDIIRKDITIAVNSSDKEFGCIFEYHLEVNPLTDLVLNNDNKRYYIELIQNANSDILLTINNINPIYMLNGIIYPTDTVLTNARSRQLVEHSTGLVTADINGFILTAEPFSIDQSKRSIIVEQQNVVNGLKQYINFYTTVQISIPYYISYYIDGNIHNEDYLEYSEALVGKVVTAVARPEGQPVIGTLDSTLASIENYYDFSKFTIKHVNLFDKYIPYGYNSVVNRAIINTEGVQDNVFLPKHPDFTLNDILNYNTPDVGTTIETEAQSVLLNEPIIWQTIDKNTNEVLNVKSFDRYGRERTEQMNQLVNKTIEIFSNEHLYKYDYEFKYLDDTIAVFDGYSPELIKFEDKTISLKRDNTSVSLIANPDNDILAISGIISFNGLSSINGSEILIELYRDNTFIDRAGYRRTGIGTEILYNEYSYKMTFNKYHAKAFNFDYRTSEIKPNIIKIYMNRKNGDIFSLSDLELTKRI